MELEVFKHTIWPLREKMLRVAIGLVGEEEAEDIVQEAFLKLWQVRQKLDDYRSVEALAVTITKNGALDHLRLKKPQSPEWEMGHLQSAMSEPDQQTEQRDAVNCIRRLIEKLPGLQQIIIRMKDVEGYEMAEIAEITGTQIETVRVNLSRARKKIREQFLILNQQGV